jgi:hypothetical protein
MLVSNCCGARFYEPDYPDNDICTDCGEHAGAEDEDEIELLKKPILDVKKVNEMIKKTPEYKRGKSMISSIGYRGEE